MDFFHPCLVSLLLILVGCAGQSRQAPTTLPTEQFTLIHRDDLGVQIHLPVGWNPERHDDRENAITQTWVGPSKRVALGVIHVRLPFPVGHEITLAGFLNRFAKEDGAVTLVEKKWDDNRQCFRFIAHGQRRQIESLLIVRGMDGWVVFAGTLLDKPAPPDELSLARQAREAVQTAAR